MFGIVRLAIIVIAAVGGYLLARRFVRRRLRFVDAVYSPFAPWVAGLIAALIATPVTLLPFITGTAAALFGVGTGLGTASGVKALKRGEA